MALDVQVAATAQCGICVEDCWSSAAVVASSDQCVEEPVVVNGLTAVKATSARCAGQVVFHLPAAAVQTVKVPETEAVVETVAVIEEYAEKATSACSAGQVEVHLPDAAVQNVQKDKDP